MRGHDRRLRAALGLDSLCGVDEAGRGPLAGPVVAAAVILPRDWDLPGLDDSKKLDGTRRTALETEILRQALAWAVAEASVEEIDRLNILQATFLAMGRAVEQLGCRPDFLLVDGRDFPFTNQRGRALVHGDGLSASVAAASILAKQARDRAMVSAAGQWPGYGFDCHKGYGTARHLAALSRLGPCPLHRRTFSPVRQALAREVLAAADGTRDQRDPMDGMDRVDPLDTVFRAHDHPAGPLQTRSNPSTGSIKSIPSIGDTEPTAPPQNTTHAGRART